MKLVDCDEGRQRMRAREGKRGNHIRHVQKPMNGGEKREGRGWPREEQAAAGNLGKEEREEKSEGDEGICCLPPPHALSSPFFPSFLLCFGSLLLSSPEVCRPGPRQHAVAGHSEGRAASHLVAWSARSAAVAPSAVASGDGGGCTAATPTATVAASSPCTNGRGCLGHGAGISSLSVGLWVEHFEGHLGELELLGLQDAVLVAVKGLDEVQVRRRQDHAAGKVAALQIEERGRTKEAKR